MSDEATLDSRFWKVSGSSASPPKGGNLQSLAVWAKVSGSGIFAVPAGLWEIRGTVSVFGTEILGNWHRSDSATFHSGPTVESIGNFSSSHCLCSKRAGAISTSSYTGRYPGKGEQPGRGTTTEHQAAQSNFRHATSWISGSKTRFGRSYTSNLAGVRRTRRRNGMLSLASGREGILYVERQFRGRQVISPLDSEIHELFWQCRYEDQSDNDDYHYVRVRYTNDQWAWSSPIFVRSVPS